MADVELYSSDWPVICADCQGEFQPGDEFLVVYRVKLLSTSRTGNFMKILEERTVCVQDCLGNESEVEGTK
jgi:hypothetical protein